MTRRLTVALLAAVAVALLLVGMGTIVLSGLDDRRDARRRLEEQADDVASLAAFLDNRSPDALPPIRRALRVDGVEILPVTTALREDPPQGVEVTTADVAALRNGEAVSWTRGGRIVAAAVVPDRQPLEVVVVTEDVPLIDRGLIRWWALASLLTLVTTAGGGVVLARRLARPLRAVGAATERIAGGDLDADVEVPRTDDEIAALARSVNAMAASLARARSVERNFMLSVSHDLRTPLTSIRGWAEAVSDGTATDPARAAAVILSEARRLERLVADLLDLAKLEARSFSLSNRDLDVGEVVEDAAEAFRPAFEEEGVALVVQVDGPVPGAADPDRLGQVVANLVENALKHAASEVRVSARQDGGRAVVIEVVDDGEGIPAEDRSKVFERLYVGQGRARRPVGSGLGLAIVAELVAAMGGRIECGSPVEGGTTMTVRLG